MRVLRALATLAVAIVIPAGGVLTTASPATAAPPGGAAIVSVKGFGSGCTADSVTASWDDATQFRVTYSAFGARAGGSSGPLEFRKACQLSVELKIPAGYTAALVRANALLYANVAAGATVTHRTNVYWQGMTATNRFARSQTGPFDDNWLSAATSDPDSLIYSPCNESRLLNINSSLTITRGTSDPAAVSSAQYDTSFGGANGIYQLVWKACGS
jgi:hypothetical protein